MEIEPESRCEVHPEVVLVVQTLGDRHVWWPILANDCGDVQFVVSASSSPSQPLVDRVNPQRKTAARLRKPLLSPGLIQFPLDFSGLLPLILNYFPPLDLPTRPPELSERFPWCLQALSQSPTVA